MTETTPRPTSERPRKRHTTLNLADDVIDWLAAEAERRDTSASALAREIIRAAMAQKGESK
jgi:plasmid stability protein